MYVLDDECEAAGLDPKEVERVARNLSKWGKEAKKLGLTIFGGCTGSLRTSYVIEQLIVASIAGNYDGGDGACGENEQGLMVGETA